MFTPKLEILPPAQRRLWDELRHTPGHFVLYGGTALALRLAHRSSEDFDFFSNSSFVPELLHKAIPYLHDAEMSQFETNTLTAIVDRSGPVKISFFGGLALNRVKDPDVAADNGVQVASLLDVAATTLATIQQRAQGRDYEDIAAIVGAGISLCNALAAASTAYGKQFNGALSLKALAYFADGDLPQLSARTQEKLRTLAAQVDLKDVPVFTAKIGDERGRAQMNPRDLKTVARRVVWFKKPEDALQDTKLFLAHVMTYGTLSDITTTLHYFSESDFKAVLDDPPPGIFDRRSWTYWNVRYGREPVPALPKRHLGLQS